MESNSSSSMATLRDDLNPPPMISSDLKKTIDTLSHGEIKALLNILEAVLGCTNSSQKARVLSNASFYSHETPLYMDFLNETTFEKNFFELQNTVSREEISGSLILDLCELVVTYGVQFFLTCDCPLYLIWMNDCYNRCTAEYIRLQPHLRKALNQLSESWRPDMTQIRDIILRFAVLCLRCPEYFSSEQISNVDFSQLNIEAILRLTTKCKSCSSLFLIHLLENLFSSSEEDFVKMIHAAVDSINKILRLRSLADTRSDAMESLCSLTNAHKNVSALLAKHPSFFPAPQKSLSERWSAWNLANETLLGNVMRPTPLDEGMFLYNPSQCTRIRCFSSLKSRSLRSLMKSGEIVRETLLETINTATAWILTLCRHGARQECLQWISSLIQGNKKRIQQSIISQLAYFNNFSVSMETFALRMAVATRCYAGMLIFCFNSLEYHGFSFTGCNMNVFWVLLKLLEPVKLHKITMLDVRYLLSEEASVFLEPLVQESRLCSLDELKVMEERYRSSDGAQGPPKFPTQILFLTFFALRYLFCPALKELTNLREVLHSRQSENATQQNESPGHKSYDDLLTEYICYTCVLGHSSFLSSWWNFVNISITWLSYLFVVHKPLNESSESDTEISENEMIFQNLKDDPSRIVVLLQMATSEVGILTDISSVAFNILPYCVMEDLMEAIRFFLSLPFTHSFASDPIVAPLVKTLPCIHAELLVAFCLFIFQSGDIIRSPHCRWSCGYEPLSDLHSHPFFSSRIDQIPGVAQSMIPALIRAFIDAQKDGYYVRIRRRLSYIIHFGKLLQINCYIESLKGFLQNKETHDTFVRFLAMLVESMTWLLEEGMSTLAEIKKKEGTQGAQHQQDSGVAHLENHENRSSSSTHIQSQEEDDFDPRGFDEGRVVSEIPFEQLERLCKGLTDAGLRTIQVVALVVKICGDVIIHSPVLLPQVVTCLNCCLEHLVGPKGLQLKVSNFQKYNFDPKALLATVIDIYISLANFDSEDNARIASCICNDTRYFKHAVFRKACRIATREALVSSRNLEVFTQLIQSLEKQYVDLAAEEEWFSHIWNDIPDEYKDPIMDEIMQDPVLLPTSGHIMDRKTIERHLLTEEFDPYNRMPLKSSDLIPQEELRLRIQDFLSQKKK